MRNKLNLPEIEKNCMNEKQTIDLLLLLMAKKMKEKLDERKLR